VAPGHYADLYVPPDLDRSTPTPLIVFLHGSGSAPAAYHSYVQDAADELGLVLVLPKSVAFEGWGSPADPEGIAEALEKARQVLLIDGYRIGAAGHSSGGAYAVLLGVETRGWCAVFALASPAVPLGAAGNPLYHPPVHLYYGGNDPNYSFQGAFTLIDRLEEHGNEVTLDVQLGYGHNSWPPESMLAGLRFVVEHPRPAPQTAAASAAR